MAAAAASAEPPPERSSDAAKKALSDASGRALQGDARAAIGLLQAVPESAFAKRDRAIRNCMIERFGPGSAPDEPAAAASASQRAVGAFHAYWHASLTDPEGKAAEEQKLEARLETLLGLPADSDWNEVEAALKARAEAEGVHALMGRTPPLLEFMLWKSDERQVRQVPLPEGPHPIAVHVLDDFASLGWSAFATCGRSFTGGWVGDEAIYAVKPGWKSLEDENFLVSFLAHETQHFADKKRFGALESWELEYRGKLAELALAETTLPRLLAAFESNQGDDPAVPHSYANRLVLTRLRAELGLAEGAALDGVQRDAISRAAKTLLSDDSASRRARKQD